MDTARRAQTRAVRAGTVIIGAGHPLVVQSMAATRTRDPEATIAQVRALHEAGAGLVRLAVDSGGDCEALARIHEALPQVNLTVDLQESYQLAPQVAPHVVKIRYNPGHLHHHEKGRSTPDKVAGLVEVATRHGCALRIGVNCGSVDPALASRFGDDQAGAMVESAVQHCRILDDLGFHSYLVSLKGSCPELVVAANRRFAALMPQVPLHLGLTEAGMPPEGIIKSRLALEPLLAAGIGDTLRVSLTLPFDRKWEEVAAGRQILDDVAAGRLLEASGPGIRGLDIVSCPSCSRVENSAFVDLALKVRETTAYARLSDITIAVMGCRVNGPGETDRADLGLWCAADFVNLKRGTEQIGAFRYDEVIGRLLEELDRLIEERARGPRGRNGTGGQALPDGGGSR
ncbi:MAG: (E)-4-hydroxy-3-methylbut-2-enyl-diphosphate synthase [Candidatus Riflebacteria bacterium]|nr:(E)-4-hydroxy-3-methylbut-2-enyl-diphosphate synthase [Candidatus Riflebacteria bacterium]